MLCIRGLLMRSNMYTYWQMKYIGRLFLNGYGGSDFIAVRHGDFYNTNQLGTSNAIGRL